MKKNKITGLIGTAVLHILLLILLLVIAIRRPQVQEEGGVPVMLGNTELSQGNADPYTLTDIDIMNEPEAPAPDVSEPETVPPVETKEEIITQTEEETVAVPKKEPKKEKPKKETPKKDVPKKEAVKPKEKTEAEKRAEAEKAAAEKKAAAERAACGRLFTTPCPPRAWKSCATSSGHSIRTTERSAYPGALQSGARLTPRTGILASGQNLAAGRIPSVRGSKIRGSHGRRVVSSGHLIKTMKGRGLYVSHQDTE